MLERCLWDYWAAESLRPCPTFSPWRYLHVMNCPVQIWIAAPLHLNVREDCIHPQTTIIQMRCALHCTKLQTFFGRFCFLLLVKGLVNATFVVAGDPYNIFILLWMNPFLKEHCEIFAEDMEIFKFWSLSNRSTDRSGQIETLPFNKFHSIWW